MNFNKIFSVCLLCLLAIKAEAKFIDVNSFQLENGLSVFVVENHRAPIVESRLFYKAGSLNDMTGKGGIAHLLEHMMFRGTKKIKDKEFNNIVEENGVKNNAYTTLDHTTYYEFMGIDKLDLMLALEADRMKNLKIDDEAFLKERDVVLQERKQRFETNPSSLFYENMNTLLWQDGKMANPVSGREKEIIGLTKEDAYEFYSRYYDVSNAILVLAGDITLNQAQEVVGKYFGKLKSNGFDVIEDNESIKKINAKLEMKLKGINEPRYVKYIRLDKGFLSKREMLALSILKEYLTGDDSAIMYDKLVYQDKKFLSVDVGGSYYPLYGGQIGISVVLLDKKMKIDEIEKIVDGALEWGYKNLDENKLEEIKNTYLSGAIYLADNVQNVAQFVGGMVMDGYSVDEIKNFDELIKDISVDDVKNVFDKIFRGELSFVIGYLEGQDNEI